MADLKFIPLARSDFPLLQRWLAQPHVHAWWHELLDLDGLEEKYGPPIDGTEPCFVYMVHHQRKPIGFIQWYRWGDFPGHALSLGAEPEAVGLDLAIGEVEMLGLGVGPLAITAILAQFTPEAAALVDVASANRRSLRAFEKAGFVAGEEVQLAGEDFLRTIMRRPAR